ncbi:hypothetical protein R1sor_002336 [Riccia sorocarpa]|uniref:RING-type domain-containing protein n=1 Tax=Riccia sorocarpa TaxID=122646 RepID=A0ABD3H181_9MARC
MPGEGPTAVCSEELHERREKEMRYKKWLEQVTANAVEQALRIQLDESQRQPETGESHDSQSYSSANALPNLPPIRTHCAQKSWSLDRNSEERRTVAARIYSLLVLWKPDMSFEWRARVASAVHIFERALYQEAKTKEEYLNPLMLDLQLRQILRHFEAGTGSALLSKTSTAGRTGVFLTKSISFNSGLIEARRRPIALGDLMKMHDAGLEETSVRPRPGTIQTIHEDEAGSRENSGEDPSEPLEQQRLEGRERINLHREEADGALWEAILCGNWKDMQESLNKYSNHASKRIVKRVMVLMTKKKQEEIKKLELELRNAISESNAENLAGALWQARSDFREELKPVINKAASVLDRLLRERRLDSSGEPSSSSPLPGRVVESRRVTETPDTESLSRSGSPPLERRQIPRLGRSVTFSFRESAQYRASNSLRPEPTQRVDQNRASDVDRSTLSSALPERSPDLRYGQSVTNAMSIQRRERRLLGSLLEEAREDQRWSPSRTAAPSMQDTSFVSPRDLYVGDRNVANAIISQSDSLDMDQTSETSAASVEPSSLPSSEGPRMSLISLLHQEGEPEHTYLVNRRRLSLGMRTESSKSAEELSEEMLDGGMDPICCVCMVGRKGAAFIPCGHTFCRKCTWELRKGRGTCPLCNRKIQDILKIY